MIAEKKGTKIVTILLGAVCICLLIIIAASTVNFVDTLDRKESQVRDLQTLRTQQQSEINSLKQQISSLQDADTTNLTKQIIQKDAQIANLTNQNEELNNQITALQAQLNQKPSIQEEIRDSVMGYIKLNHPEVAKFMNDLAWTGGRATPATSIGAETYVYTSIGWRLTINYPVIPNPLYNVTSDYSAPFTGIPYRIIWTGTWQNWRITETSYVFAQ